MSLEQYFSRPDFSVPRRLIAMVNGPEGSGKTHFALTASAVGPTAYIDTDINAEGVWQKFKDRDLWHIEIKPGSEMIQNPAAGTNEYEAEWEKFKKAYHVAVDEPKIKVIIWDNATEVWELCRLSHFGRLEKVPPIKYGIANSDMRQLIRDAKARADLTLILIHKLTSEYLDDRATGKKVAAGFKDTPYLVQTVVNCWRKDKKFGITVDKCTHNPMVEGLELVEPMASFPLLMSMIHGD